MLTANKVMPQGKGLAPVLLKRAATIELDWDVLVLATGAASAPRCSARSSRAASAGRGGR